MSPDKRDELNFWRGFLLAVPLGLAIWAFIIWLIIWLIRGH
ncbi:hypothetical protein [Singulisphaera sp. PoT]